MSTNNSSVSLGKVLGIYALILVVLDLGWATFMGWLVSHGAHAIGTVSGAPGGDVTAVTHGTFVLGFIVGLVQSFVGDIWLTVFAIIALVVVALCGKKK